MMYRVQVAPIGALFAWKTRRGDKESAAVLIRSTLRLLEHARKDERANQARLACHAKTLSSNVLTLERTLINEQWHSAASCSFSL